MALVLGGLFGEVEAEAQEADAHEAELHEAEAQEADAQEAEFQEALDCATPAQLAASKALPPDALSATRKAFRAAFGFGALERATALAMSTTPTPEESSAASPAGLAWASSVMPPLIRTTIHFDKLDIRALAAYWYEW